MVLSRPTHSTKYTIPLTIKDNVGVGNIRDACQNLIRVCFLHSQVSLVYLLHLLILPSSRRSGGQGKTAGERMPGEEYEVSQCQPEMRSGASFLFFCLFFLLFQTHRRVGNRRSEASPVLYGEPCTAVCTPKCKPPSSPCGLRCPLLAGFRLQDDCSLQ